MSESFIHDHLDGNEATDEREAQTIVQDTDGKKVEFNLDKL